MLRPLRALWQGIVVFERFGHVFVVANLLAVVFALPVVTIPAAFAGLAHLAHVAHTGPTCHIDDFFAGFRANLRRGVLLGVANLGVLGILWVNFSAFSAQNHPLFTVLRIMWLVALFVWLAVQLYVWPILDEMEQPELRTALFNAVVMVLKNPFFSIVFLLGVFLLAAISTALLVLWALITPAVIASASAAAVVDRLNVYRQRR